MTLADSTLKAYTGARPDVTGMISEAPTRVLDIGCSDGTLAMSLGLPKGATVGIEIDPNLAQMARARLGQVYCDDAATATAALVEAGECFDLVICADVLEHLVDPAPVLADVRSLLTDRGQCVVCLPNVRFWTTFTQLGLHGRWPRKDRGVHDRTHLRWFTDSDSRELFASQGLRVDAADRRMRIFDDPEKRGNRLAGLIGVGPLRPFLTYQNLYRLRSA